MNINIYTEPANGHANEDAIAFARHSDDPSVLICPLADGQGGQSGGAAAAQTAVGVAIKKANEYLPLKLADPFTWVSICEEADKQVSMVPDAGHTTFVGLAVVSSFVAGASCGDSAAALLLDGGLTVLTERQYKNPPVGTGASRPTPFSARLADPWKLLIISDGVWKNIGWDRIEDLVVAESGKELLMRLREAVVESAAGRLVDDFSAIVIEP